MAMMMTGRVLLVCALCVLWCGAGSGGSAETSQVPSVPASQEHKIPKIENDTPGSAGTGVQTDNQTALQTEAAQPLPQKEPEPEPDVQAALHTGAQSSGTEKQGTGKNELQTESEKLEEELDEEEEDEDEEGEEEEEEEGAEEEKDDDDDKEDNEAEKKKKEGKVTNTTKRMSAGGQEPTSLTLVRREHQIKQISKTTQTLGDSDSSTAAS
ncbi:mucin-associated surface protein (MASP), putative, partial [Trypanosoma cruzi marinkellei]